MLYPYSQNPHEDNRARCRMPIPRGAANLAGAAIAVPGPRALQAFPCTTTAQWFDDRAGRRWASTFRVCMHSRVQAITACCHVGAQAANRPRGARRLAGALRRSHHHRSSMIVRLREQAADGVWKHRPQMVP
ncbi:MAG: hypothetical protein HOQ10_09665 [Frateuria sp.]|nr:hypothetical protein [Frateuria sp.]